jgi:hypothetical protein
VEDSATVATCLFLSVQIIHATSMLLAPQPFESLTLQGAFLHECFRCITGPRLQRWKVLL